MPQKGKNIIHHFYRRVAGEHPGAGAMEFIRHISLIGASFAIAKAISSLVNIYAGRALGPREYGKINILVSIGVIISAFIVAGINSAIVQYGVSKEARERVFSTGAVTYLVLAVLVSAFTVALRHPLCSLFSVDVKLLLLALCYALSTSAFLIASAMQQASGSFSRRGLGEIAFSLVMALVFFLVFLRVGKAYEAMAYAYIAAFSLVALFWTFRLRAFIKFRLADKAQFLKMAEYGFYYFGANLGAFSIMNIQGLILNTHLSQLEVGIYAVYYLATINIAGYLAYALNTVLFPKASATTNRRRMFDMAAKGWLYLAPAAVLVFIGAQAAVLTLMGRHQYGMNAELMTLFALCGTLMIVQSSLSQIIFAEGLRASRLALYMALVGGAVNFCACLLLVPPLKIAGVAVAFIITYVFQFAWLWKVKDSYLEPAAPRV